MACNSMQTNVDLCLSFQHGEQRVKWVMRVPVFVLRSKRVGRTLLTCASSTISRLFRLREESPAGSWPCEGASA
eukprot:3991328-Pleurochrysis_carterae.AAC.1